MAMHIVLVKGVLRNVDVLVSLVTKQHFFLVSLVPKQLFFLLVTKQHVVLLALTLSAIDPEYSATSSLVLQQEIFLPMPDPIEHSLSFAFIVACA